MNTVAQDTPFITLDGVERKLDADDLMICDHQKPLCIAGVLGGQDSSVTEKTRSIFLESAYFANTAMAQYAYIVGILTALSLYIFVTIVVLLAANKCMFLQINLCDVLCKSAPGSNPHSVKI